MAARILPRIEAILLSFLFSLGASAAEPGKVVIYTYDSFFSGQPRRDLEKAIEAKTGHGVQWVLLGDAAQIVSRYQMDLLAKSAQRAHLLVGLDQPTFAVIGNQVGKLTRAELARLGPVDGSLKTPEGFVPFNYGVLSFVVDTEKLPESSWPRKWDDLLAPAFRKKLILEDPRTSTPGLGFVLASRRVWGEAFAEKWKQLKNQWLTLAPGWSQAYGLFQKGEAPMVWSYTTSQAYHQLSGAKTSRYRAVIFSDGNPLQIEGAALPAAMPGGDEMRKAALGALEVLRAEKTQAAIPRAQWMFPVRPGVPLPWAKITPSIPEPRTKLSLDFTAGDVRETLKLWSDAIR